MGECVDCTLAPSKAARALAHTKETHLRCPVHSWRRTKQTTKVKLGKADETHDDDEYDNLVMQCKEHYALLKKVHAAIVSHVAALKAATSSGAALANVSAAWIACVPPASAAWSSADLLTSACTRTLF